jgi:TolB-like protein/DNA-binding winged helix-turn-helix (wHTH) protein/Tfp pilus assembly protein PilF
MHASSANLYEFGAFQLDPAKRLLRRLDGTAVPLTSRVFETLLFMVEHHDAVLDKERIMEAVWPDSIVEENNLAQAISKLRQVFGETPGSHSYIVTVPGRGYRFVAEVTERTATPATPEHTSAAIQPLLAASDPGLEDAVSTATTQEPIEKPIATPSGGLAIERPRRFLGLPATTPWLWAVAISAIATVFVATLFFVRYRSVPASVRTAGSSVSIGGVLSLLAPIPEKSVAVLPFDNLSDDKQNAYFAIGVQDEITSDLARIADLKVISRTSANLYKSGNPRNSREIGQQLGVAHLLEGSVQRIGNRLRVNAQLIKVPTDTHVWAQTYDRDVADLFAIQSEIARAIADQLHAKISQAEKRAIERPPTTDLNAFDLYSRAKNLHLTVGFSPKAREDLLRAADLLNQAVSRDPSFFQAFCLLSQTHGLLYSYGFDHSSARLALAEGALATASRLRPDAGETHLARAWNLYVGYRDYDAALGELKLARESLPNDPQIFELTAYIQRRQGRWEESIHSLERTLELDPRNLDALHRIALRYRDLARYDEAKLALNRALSVDLNDVTTKAMHAVVDIDWKGDTRPLHELLNQLRVKDSAALQSVPDFWLTLALVERDPASASDALAVLGEHALSDGPIQLSRTFMEGLIARMVKDTGKARSAFTAARVEQEKIVEAEPNYGPALCVLGLIDAALGRKEEALREGRRAVELLPVEKDAVNGRIMVAYFAMIAAWVGDNTLACEQLAVAVRYTSSLSYGQLKLMPWWDPLRGDPCFEQIVASIAPK